MEFVASLSAPTRELVVTLAVAVASIAVAGFARRLWLSAREAGLEIIVPLPEACVAEKRKQLAEPSIKISDSSAIQCYCPATGESLGVVNPLTANGIDRLVEKAAQSQIAWASTSFAQRRRVLRTLLKFVLSKQDDIVQVACLDSGKTRVDALFGEILVTVEKLKWTIDHGEAALRAERRPTNFLMFYKKNMVRYEPLGVIGACVSWNYPFHNVLGPIISALFTGNAIVVKNSEQTAWSSIYFLKIVHEALSACGHDRNLVQVFSCWPQTADHFTSHPQISHLTFIGSKPVAHAVAKSASKALTPLCIELGGKDAAIVLDDPAGKALSPGECERVASIIMRGVFQSAGQNCIGIERVVAMPHMYDRLIEMLTPRIKALRVGFDLDSERGGDVDVGAMISAASFNKLETIIAEAIAQGARVIAGGVKVKHPKYPHGHYFEPTLLVDVTPHMRIAKEEVFAPVCMLMRAENVQQAINITNSTIYGLGCSVFGPVSSSVARDNLDAVAREVKTGMVAINDFAVFYAVQLPFGGVRGSGYGRFAGEEGLRSICNLKSVCSDRFPSVIKTAIPGKLDYPMQAGAFTMAKGIVEFGYGDSLARMLSGIRKLTGT